ncbi:MAG: hypothetical protein ABI584_05865 [Acidobacteriota bacterium]
MPTFGHLLAGLGAFGVVAAVLLAIVLLLILPVWAILDCAASNRTGSKKALLIVLLVFFWTFGSLVYSFFITESRVMRRVSIIATACLIVLFVFSFITLTTGTVLLSEGIRKKEAEETKKSVAAFKPDTIDVASVQPFRGLFFIHGKNFPLSVSAAEFTLAGPNPERARSISDDVRHLVYDAKRDLTYGLTTHDFGMIDRASGRFEKLDVDPALQQNFSWPKGLAADWGNGEIFILVSHVDSGFFVYNVGTHEWKEVPTGIRGRSFLAFAYSPENRLFYLLEQNRQEPTFASIRTFSRSGAELGGIEITPSIPVNRGQTDYFQMTFSSGKIILMAAAVSRPGASPSKDRIFAIDPQNGKVFAAVASGGPGRETGRP